MHELCCIEGATVWRTSRTRDVRRRSLFFLWHGIHTFWRHRGTAASQNTLAGNPPPPITHSSWFPASLCSPYVDIPGISDAVHIKCRICTVMLNSLSRTHHEFFMETGSKLIGIHPYGRNGWAGMKQKTSHKPCTLCFNLSSSALGRQGTRHSLFFFFFPSLQWFFFFLGQPVSLCNTHIFSRQLT